MLMYNNITSEKTYYTETKFGKISELVKKNDRIILFVEQDGCSSCKLVKPIINNYAKENKGIVYSVTANKENGMATVFLTNFIRCRTSFRMLFRLSLTMSLLGCDDLRQELTVKVRLPR